MDLFKTCNAFQSLPRMGPTIIVDNKSALNKWIYTNIPIHVKNPH